MRALVTGANGFVGQHLVRALAARGDEVVALDLSPWRGGDLANVRSVAADVRDVTEVRGAHRDIERGHGRHGKIVLRVA